LAAQAGIDAESLEGSGPQGRIVAEDVRRATGTVAGSGAATAAPPPIPAGGDPVRSLYAGTHHREVALDGMRHEIARRLSESKQQVPHFYLSADANVDALLALRKQYNDSGRPRVSLNDLLVKAYALALQKVPAANVVWAGDALLQLERSDVGVAVAVPGGLVTPIARSADTKPLAELAAELAGLVARGRERRLQPDEYSGGSATVSNLGMYGVRSFQAIVNPPQATILAVGAAERRPVVAPDGTLRAASLLAVTLSVDHRAVDGATAGELLAAFRTLVESPLQVFL
jgi:pyruvate dehydrogenase E2 component (dihydrolipoamide acetyltransferase)